jgi:squalene-hopene/tetraprenyl-beta-curcumene cyclase
MEPLSARICGGIDHRASFYYRGRTKKITTRTRALVWLASFSAAALHAVAAEPVPDAGREQPVGLVAQNKLTVSAFASPDEPLLGQLSFVKAADSLDQMSVAWIHQHRCGSCHTTYPYLMSRPVLKDGHVSSINEVRAFFLGRVPLWETEKGKIEHFIPEVVGTAASLAIYDAQTTGTLNPLTRQALDRIWTLQGKDGAWAWTKCGWQPFEVDDYFGALLVAVGVGHAPNGYASGESARLGLTRLRAYFRATPPPSLHHQIWLLWASTKLDGLMTDEQKRTTMDELRTLQRADGGWSMQSLGKNWVGENGEKSEMNAPSDGYGTGLCVYVLRMAGMASADSTIQRGKAWLASNQRASGRWFTPSINGVEEHYISDSATAFAVLALKACE